ncbi:MAG: biopolymer transporter ExbD [Duncaniella sp.]|nr:biopolymer transporter ExbD [Duncaniella sp.]
MALKRSNRMMAEFSMASMTDVIFLLLIFFMVTSTFVFPTALEVNLPESSRQTTLKPTRRLFVDAENRIYLSVAGEEPVEITWEEAPSAIAAIGVPSEEETAAGADPAAMYIAVYADEDVTYGTLVKVLDMGASANLKMVLATKPAPSSARPADAPSN